MVNILRQCRNSCSGTSKVHVIVITRTASVMTQDIKDIPWLMGFL